EPVLGLPPVVPAAPVLVPAAALVPAALGVAPLPLLAVGTPGVLPVGEALALVVTPAVAALLAVLPAGRGTPVAGALTELRAVTAVAAAVRTGAVVATTVGAPGPVVPTGTVVPAALGPVVPTGTVLTVLPGGAALGAVTATAGVGGVPLTPAVLTRLVPAVLPALAPLGTARGPTLELGAGALLPHLTGGLLLGCGVAGLLAAGGVGHRLGHVGSHHFGSSRSVLASTPHGATGPTSRCISWHPHGPPGTVR